MHSTCAENIFGEGEDDDVTLAPITLNYDEEEGNGESLTGQANENNKAFAESNDDDDEVDEDMLHPDYVKYRKELEAEPDQLFPSYAVMYKLKPEYMSQTYSVATADHNEYCKTFERLLQSETIAMHNSKGVVVLFAGLTPDDKAELSDEVDRFVAKDPLIEQGIVDTWNILDLDPYVEAGAPGTTPDGVILEDEDTLNDDVVEGEVMTGEEGGDGDGDGEEGGEDGDDEGYDDEEGEGGADEDSLDDIEANEDALG